MSSKKEELEEPLEVSVKGMLAKVHTGPVFIQNPDGSLAEGLPPGYCEPTPPQTPRSHVAEASAAVNADIIRVLARHELLFLALLFLLLVVEIAFEIMHMRYREEAVFELSLIYPSLSITVIKMLYWLACGAEFVYCIVYFSLGVIAAFRSKPRLYQRFSTIALVGTLGQLPLAYLNRFNLLIFFLRFIAYAYARFHWNLLQGIGIIREELLL
mmetsp:Transcript_89221/g.139625  ORF Transcript_89221/g.139625 Transcript_89221/m.139625 type:complete len:213 (-) Transcript_89221:55-693(-)